MRILLLEDDPLQLELATRWLEDASHRVIGVTRGADAMKLLGRETFDLVILDWMIPDMGGDDLLRWLRERHLRLPVMFATARDEEHEVASILRLGADDYVVKPLRRLEFLARIEALGRRTGALGAGDNDSLEVGPYRLDPPSRSITLEGRSVKVTPRMWDVAIVLFRKRGELVSRAHLYELVWGRREQLDTRTVDTHVSRLRNALQLDGRHGLRLSAVYQHGYRLEAVARATPSDEV